MLNHAADAACVCNNFAALRRGIRAIFKHSYFTFLRASAMLKHVLAIGWTSVHLSVTRWYCIKTAEHIVMLSSLHDSPFILVLYVSRSSRNSNGVTPCGAAKQKWGTKISQFSTNNLLYLLLYLCALILLETSALYKLFTYLFT